jgi:DNA polymerase III psi subunit
MKKVNVNTLDLDPETIGNLTPEQANEIEGGSSSSCWFVSCNGKGVEEAE